jgi:hypothetical protein
MLEKLIPTKGKQVKNCWEFLNCQEETKFKCRVFISDLGQDCWLISKSHNNKNFENCINCPWFKEKNPEFVKFFQSTQ